MPTYEYKCESCGYHFEELQGINDKPLEKCPECNGKVKRLLSAGSGIIFKGNGFYQTDYKSTSTPCSGDKCKTCKENKE